MKISNIGGNTKIEPCLFENHCIRNMEKFGNRVVLIKLYPIEKRSDWSYHYFFKVPTKLPLDIAVNPFDYKIEYVKFIILHDRIDFIDKIESFKLLEESVKIFDEKLSIKVMDLYFDKEFSIKSDGKTC